jgi:hypothetical protein
VAKLDNHFDRPTHTPLHRLSFSQIIQGINDTLSDSCHRMWISPRHG